MRVRTVLLIVMLLLIAAFVGLNWPAFTAPSVLNLLLLQVEAPLGLVMLALLVAVVLLFAITMLLWQGTILLESRRHTKELQAQRLLADQAEASRFTELRAVMHEELERLAARIASSQEALRQEMREQSNALAASIGELDDRVQKPGGGATPA